MASATKGKLKGDLMKYEIGDVVSLVEKPTFKEWSGAKVRIVDIKTDCGRWPYVVEREGHSELGLVDEVEIANYLENQRQLNVFLIRSTENKEDWWNNENGWGDILSATVFTPYEAAAANLPMKSKWVMFTEERD